MSKFETTEDIAKQILFAGLKRSDFEQSGWIFRKDYDWDDLKNAVHKGMNPKITGAKTEREIECIASRINRIIKKSSNGQKNE